MDLNTVGDLILYLATFDPSTTLIVDSDGNTYPLNTDDLETWNPKDPESPVAFYINRDSCA